MNAGDALRLLNGCTVGEAAAALCFRFSILPLRPGSKLPWTRHGVHDAHDGLRPGWTMEALADWFDAGDLNLGLATGHLVDALDIDTKEGRSGFASLARLRAAGLLRGAVGVAATPSGGWHLFYPSDGSNRNHSLARAGVDLRGAGGYVVVAPSVVNGVPYRWLSSRSLTEGHPLDWGAVRALLDPPRSEPLPWRGSRGSGLSDWLAGREPGDRNASLFWASRRLVEAGEDPRTLADAALASGLAAGEVAATIGSAIRSGP